MGDYVFALLEILRIMEWRRKIVTSYGQGAKNLFVTNIIVQLIVSPAPIQFGTGREWTSVFDAFTARCT